MRDKNGKLKVLIVGGGVSGLTAAHELVRRNFHVTLYEGRQDPCEHPGHEDGAFGGKARSYSVGEPTSAPEPGIGKQFQRALHADVPDASADSDPPGEHGFRFFPAFYRHLPDTMSQIPYPSSQGTVAGNLVSPGRDQFASYRVATLIPFISEFPDGKGVDDLKKLLDGVTKLGLETQDILFYFQRLWRVLTSCQERRFKELEKTAWIDFVDAKKRSAAFHDYLGAGSTRNLVASRAQEANARIIAEISIQTWLPILFPRPWNFNDSGDRVLRGPTQEMWIRPWVTFLREQHVEFVTGKVLDAVEIRNGEIASLTFRTGVPDSADLQDLMNMNTVAERRETAEKAWNACDRYPPIDAKEFAFIIFALPVEQMAKLITPPMVELDPDLDGIPQLADHTRWMSGIQFYLADAPPGDLTGHINYVDSPWALTSILQSAKWYAGFRKTLKEREIGAVLSVCISDWQKEGFNRKTAFHCTPKEIAEEVWNQIVRAMPAVGRVNVIGYAIDEDLWEQHDKSRLQDDAKYLKWQNAEPLLINKADSWRLRPRSGTRIPNMVLAGDYVRTYTGLACMEAANESARRAVNEVLLRSGSTEPPCEVWELPEPFFAKAAQVRDRVRFDKGEPWQDVPGSPMSVLLEGGSHAVNVFKYFLDHSRQESST